VGGECQSDCVNNGGSPVSARTPSCTSNLNTFTHASQPNASEPAVATACGLYNHLLNPETGVKAKYPHLRFVLSVGGWYDSNFFSMATSDKYRASFVNSVTKYVAAFGFDGIDFDWEYPGFEHGGEPVPGGAKQGDPENTIDCATGTCQNPARNKDGANYAKFLKEIKSSLAEEQARTNRADAYIISMAGAAGQDKLAKLDLTSMCKDLTYVNVMSYDMHGSFDAQTNHQSPLHCTPEAGQKYCYSVSNAVEWYLSHGCTADQLHIGVPTYAHQYNSVPAGSDSSLPGLYQNFTGPSEYTCQSNPAACVPAYKDGGAKWEAEKHYDSESGASYAYDAGSQTFYSYDDERSIAAKAEYLKEKNLGGFMYWYIGGDDTSSTLLSAMHNGLN